MVTYGIHHCEEEFGLCVAQDHAVIVIDRAILIDIIVLDISSFQFHAFSIKAMYIAGIGFALESVALEIAVLIKNGVNESASCHYYRRWTGHV